MFASISAFEKICPLRWACVKILVRGMVQIAPHSIPNNHVIGNMAKTEKANKISCVLMNPGNFPGPGKYLVTFRPAETNARVTARLTPKLV